MEIGLSMLANQPFLTGIAERHLKVLLEQSMPATFKMDEFIFYEGDPANRFYLILEGRVSLESPVEQSGFRMDTVPIETISKGGVLGWSWLFPPYYWRFDARAVTPVKAIFFYGTALREQCEHDHDFGYELMKRMTTVAVERLQAARRREQSYCSPELNRA